MSEEKPEILRGRKPEFPINEVLAYLKKEGFDIDPRFGVAYYDKEVRIWAKRESIEFIHFYKLEKIAEGWWVDAEVKLSVMCYKMDICFIFKKKGDLDAKKEN
ncbi:MAG: hypothetical protein DSO07_07290 [Thermoproteota archaeon]|uniref:Uncharacterized protein n=1 Tax=Candidatus Methanodesulfokora washburnensis TaxID=2478471 RepID=A0A3R9PFH6_9CREN|nr:hypothetical protein [Candidatus Methanodesulfokores washburnensis]RSN71648.1 hypothetical protein D6D85_15680 [Candidatus Methanodesulfokores washburnensis]TDA40932.1 MAG: hypothetical protein DSO07_07290 [Candidatus Korarchaeota archaeon]